MSQDKVKKKLHYDQDEDNGRSQLRIKDVFTLRDIDLLFDDIDADSELLSPLPKSSDVVTQKIIGVSSHSDKLKPLYEQVHMDALIKANGIQVDGIIDKESPFKEIAPLKTSSPIALATAGAEAADEIRPMVDPLLFEEDEELVEGGLSNRPGTQHTVIKSHHSDSGSLASPPERIEFRKTTKPVAGSLLRDKDPIGLLVQKNEQKPRETEECVNEMVEETGKRLSFQLKLKNALMPKSSCSRKPAAASVPPPVDLEEDFIILDDEAPVLFVIPQKTEVIRNKRTAKTPKESVPAEPHSSDQLSQSEDNNHQQGASSKRNPMQIESLKKQMKGKCGKTSEKKSKDAVTDVLEHRANPVSEELGGEASDWLSSQTAERLKDVKSSGKQRTKGTTPDVLPDTLGEGPPVPRTSKKSSKSSASRQDRPKKESNKVTTAAGPIATKSNKNRKNIRNSEALSKTNKQTLKRQIEMEQISHEENDSVGPQAVFKQQEEQQRTAINKKSSSKQDVLKNAAKTQSGKQTKNLEPKVSPAVASDSSSDVPVTSRRKRKPPGAWWLTSQDESSTEGCSESNLGPAQEPKNSMKTPTKHAAVEVSEATQASRPVQGKQKKLKTSHNELKPARREVENPKKVTTSGNDPEVQQKTAKKAGGWNEIRTKRTKSTVTRPQVSSTSEEKVGAASNESPAEVSPGFCQYRQHKPVAGKKQVFDKVYASDSESAQKQPLSSVRRPESSEPDDVPLKRHRRAPSNWWEVPQSQESTNGPSSPPSPPPQKSKTPNDPIPDAFIKESTSKRTKNHTRNINRNIISTPKSIKRSLASMNAIFASERVNVVKSGQRRRKQGRRNILHSLEDQSDYSSENVAHGDDQTQGNSHSSSRFTSRGTTEPSETRNRCSAKVSSDPNTLSDVDVAFRSGPSSVLELQRHEEDDELPPTRVTPHVRRSTRVLSQCDLCGPPLQKIVLEKDDWNNLFEWFCHLWPPALKVGRVVSPDDFHWHSYGGRAMGHTVDLQNGSFSHGKILLGSFMKKPPQTDHNTVSVFNIISSCVRVDVDGVKSVYNSGQVFMIPSGRVYSIHNLCQEPAVLIYHRTEC